MFADKVPILMYHRIGEPAFPGDNKYSISAELFQRHMSALKKAGWVCRSMDDFLDWHSGKISLPAKSFVLTFDDGYASVHAHATPILNRLGWRATMFIVTDLIGGDDEWMRLYSANSQRLLSRDQIIEMANQGWSIGSHAAIHCDLTSVCDTELEGILMRSREELTKLLNRPCCCLAYPYGRYCERVKKIATRVGYSVAFSVKPGFNRPSQDILSLRRIDVFGTDSATALLRKIRLGSNDGSFFAMVTYYLKRLLRGFSVRK